MKTHTHTHTHTLYTAATARQFVTWQLRRSQGVLVSQGIQVKGLSHRVLFQVRTFFLVVKAPAADATDALQP
jgi:hypothetical protein